MVKNYNQSPIAYGVDIGVADTEGRCFVIEANDRCNLGNYGLDSIYYGEMMVARWFEIMGKSLNTSANELKRQAMEAFAKEIYGRI